MELHYYLHDVAGYINWLYFFHTWGFPARYGSISHIHGCEACRSSWLLSFPKEEQEKAHEAIRLYDEAQAMLRQLDGTYQTHALVELLEANGDGDDILCHPRTRLPMLRQQHGDECLCWADFLLPADSNQKDTMGVYATSVDEGIVSNDDEYHHLLSQTLADRLAEATAERMHETVRRELWGYAKEERLSVEEMFQEKYVGCRPAVGYPSLPDQSLNFLIDELIDMKRIGIQLTESGAMRPHASTSGLMFRHPKARHFSIGNIGNDQLSDYARRRGMPEDTMRRFLAANLS